MYRKDISEVYYVNYIDIINERVSSDHAHTPVSMPPHLPVSKVVKYTKEKSGRKLQGEFQEYLSQSVSLWLLAVSSGG